MADNAVFTHPVLAHKADIDQLGHVNNVVYLRWVQEVATAHWLAAASADLQQRYLWLVLRHEIDYHKPAFAGDQITGHTWVGDHEGAKFDRFVELRNTETNQLLAAAKTTWCLLDAASLRPRRIPPEILALL